MTFTISNIEKAYNYLSRKRVYIPAIDNLPELEQKHLQDYLDLTAVIAAINQEDNDGKPWEPNWNDYEEEKWRPFFGVEASEENPSGSGFSDTRTLCGNAVTTVGSRLLLKTEDGLLFATETFPDLYKSVYLKLKQ